MWNTVASLPALAPRAVHVWCACLDQPATRLAAFQRVLSADEQERAARFYFDRDRRRFTAGRGILRDLLGRYLACTPAELTFCYGSHGKPALAPRPFEESINFNLAHSGDVALYAFSREAPVGIDVEHVRPFEDAPQISKNVFTAAENQAVQGTGSTFDPNLFFTYWVCKEAYIKATGSGLSHPPSAIEIQFAGHDYAKAVVTADPADRKSQWHLHLLRPIAGYVGALAVQAQEVVVQTWCWSKS
jgi:4'-phosphopantetheinyl transferase